MIAADLFSGSGGFTQGAKQAGVKVIWCANHWKEAVDIHRSNHPKTEHVVQDLRQFNFRNMPDVDLLLASPCCQGHSRSNGKTMNVPKYDNSRATAYAVFEAACCKLPKFIIVENVLEFRNWGTSQKKGIFYERWLANFQDLGYLTCENVLNASDFGVAQDRKRLFITMVLNEDEPIVLTSPYKKQVPARFILEWDKSHKWNYISSLCYNTRKRIEVGRIQHGDKFLVQYNGRSYGGRSLDRPLGTVTTKDRFALVDGSKARMLTLNEYKQAMGFPKTYILPDTHKDALHMLGNAVVPNVAESIIRQVVKHNQNYCTK